MKYVAAFLLARLAAAETGAEVDAAQIKQILASVDCKIDEDRLSEFLAEVEGKDVNELIANGTAKFASFGGGGGGAAAPAAAAGGAAAPAAEEKKAAAPVEESDEDMGDFGLFD